MIIDSMTPSAIKKLRWTVSLLAFALIIGAAIVSFLWWNNIYRRMDLSVWDVIWGVWINAFGRFSYFFITAVSILKWPLIGGAFMTAISSYVFVIDVVFIARFSPIPNPAYLIAGVVMAFLVTICGIILILIGFKKHKAVTPPA